MKKFTSKLILPVFILIAINILSCKTTPNQPMHQKNNPSQQELNYAIANLSYVPLRAEANHRSEMVTQVLFAEYMTVLETKGDWCHVKLAQDHYKGWIELRQIQIISKENFTSFKESAKTTVTNSFTKIQLDGVNVLLPKGTDLSFYHNGVFLFNETPISFEGTVKNSTKRTPKIVETAYSYLNTPYLWGGKTEFGLDCSGLSQMVYHLNGIAINRDASQQAKQGELVAFLSEAKAGDLAFFDENDRITHVGIVLDEQKIIHAAQGKVRIDSLDNEGIYNKNRKKYTHHLRMIRRY